MKILITNDDGVYSLGLKFLVEAAKKYGECFVIAPKYEQSAKSHSLNIKDELEFKQITDIIPGVKTYYLDSTPADCVRVAHSFFKNEFDLVLSGVNNGYNLGEDIIYSGTTAAATEAVLLGKKAIAFSTQHGDVGKIYPFLDEVLQHFIENNYLELWPLFNINIPLNYKKIEYTCQGFTHFPVIFSKEGDYVRSVGRPIICSDDIEYSDVDCVYNNNVSITPLMYDRTNIKILKKLIIK